MCACCRARATRKMTQSLYIWIRFYWKLCGSACLLSLADDDLFLSRWWQKFRLLYSSALAFIERRRRSRDTQAGRQAPVCSKIKTAKWVSLGPRLSFHLEGAREVFFWARGNAFAQEFYTSAKVNEKRQLIPCERAIYADAHTFSLAADVLRLNAFLRSKPLSVLCNRIIYMHSCQANHLTMFNKM